MRTRWMRNSCFVALALLASARLVCAQQIAVNGVSAPSAVSVSAGVVVRVDVTDGPGNATDWIGLYPVGAADTNYVDWQYLSGTTAPPVSGVTAATIAFQMPVTAGDYELRLFANNGYTRLATSASVTVEPTAAVIAVNGVAAPAPSSATAGATVSVQVTNGPANATDWIGLFPVGAPDTSYLDWRYLNGTMAPPASGLSSATLV